MVKAGMNRRKLHCQAVTLMELLCVIAIISILLALYLPAIGRAFGRVKDFLFGDDFRAGVHSQSSVPVANQSALPATQQAEKCARIWRAHPFNLKTERFSWIG